MRLKVAGTHCQNIEGLVCHDDLSGWPRNLSETVILC